MVLLSGCFAQESEPEFLSTEKSPAEEVFHSQCRVQGEAIVSASKHSLTVKYSEPTRQGNGQPLNNLSHTTIYVGTGSSLNKVQEVPATSSSGGGQISEVFDS